MRLAPLGDNALVLCWGEAVDEATLGKVRAATVALHEAGIQGLIDIVPAFASITLFYDVARAGHYAHFVTRVTAVAEAAAAKVRLTSDRRRVEIPVCYETAFAPDLPVVAARLGLSPEAVIERHVSAEYVVHALGFVPGFAYLGGLPVELHTPRRATPRVTVPGGSVGIGGSQTGVYPFATPGGWQLIGRTPRVMFDPTQAEPAVLRATDRVRFRRISETEFSSWK